MFYVYLKNFRLSLPNSLEPRQKSWFSSLLTRQGRARQGRSSTKEGLPKSVHIVDTLTSFHKSSPQLFHSIPQTGSDKSSRTRQVPNVVNLLRASSQFFVKFLSLIVSLIVNPWTL